MRGLRTKLASLSLSVISSSYDILFFTETWLSADISNLELGITNFDIYRKDRDSITSFKSRGGGVLVAIKSILSSRILPTTHDDIEAIFVLVYVGTDNIILSSVYFPPNSDISLYEKYCEDLENVSDLYPDADLICCGDFNLPGVCWKTEPDKNPVKITKTLTVIAQSISLLNMVQLNDISNSNNVLLDLVFSSFESIVVSSASDI